MRLRYTPIQADWIHGPVDGLHHLEDQPEALCEHAGLHQCVNMHAHQSMTEATYKEIASLIDGNFLNQKIRAEELKGIQLEGFEDDTMQFRIESSKFLENGIRYQCLVKFDEWDDYGQDVDFNFPEKARLLLWVGNIRLWCGCPSFLYWGYQYILTVLDASIYPEERYPEIRNPGERGSVCKHLNRILRVLPFYSGHIAKELKRQYGG